MASSIRRSGGPRPSCSTTSPISKRRRKAPDAGLYYGRRGTPTHWALEDALTGLEAGAAGTKLFPSGVAAISTALLAVTKAGDDILITDSAYDPTRAFANDVLKRMGIDDALFRSAHRRRHRADLLQPNTSAIMLESPGSLTFEMQDIPAITRWPGRAASPR